MSREENMRHSTNGKGVLVEDIREIMRQGISKAGRG